MADYGSKAVRSRPAAHGSGALFRGIPRSVASYPQIVNQVPIWGRIIAVQGGLFSLLAELGRAARGVSPPNVRLNMTQWRLSNMYGLTPQELELSALIIEALNLPVNPQDVDPEAPLYGGTLGLDSIDILEISMVIAKQYGFMISSENDNKVEIFSCLRNLCAYVQTHKAK